MVAYLVDACGNTGDCKGLRPWCPCHFLQGRLHILLASRVLTFLPLPLPIFGVLLPLLPLLVILSAGLFAFLVNFGIFPFLQTSVFPALLVQSLFPLFVVLAVIYILSSHPHTSSPGLSETASFVDPGGGNILLPNQSFLFPFQ